MNMSTVFSILGPGRSEPSAVRNGGSEPGPLELPFRVVLKAAQEADDASSRAGGTPTSPPAETGRGDPTQESLDFPQEIRYAASTTAGSVKGHPSEESGDMLGTGKTDGTALSPPDAEEKNVTIDFTSVALLNEAAGPAPLWEAGAQPDRPLQLPEGGLHSGNFSASVESSPPAKSDGSQDVVMHLNALWLEGGGAPTVSFPDAESPGPVSDTGPGSSLAGAETAQGLAQPLPRTRGNSEPLALNPAPTEGSRLQFHNPMPPFPGSVKPETLGSGTLSSEGSVDEIGPRPDGSLGAEKQTVILFNSKGPQQGEDPGETSGPAAKGGQGELTSRWPIPDRPAGEESSPQISAQAGREVGDDTRRLATAERARPEDTAVPRQKPAGPSNATVSARSTSVAYQAYPQDASPVAGSRPVNVDGSDVASSNQAVSVSAGPEISARARGQSVLPGSPPDSEPGVSTGPEVGRAADQNPPGANQVGPSLHGLAYPASPENQPYETGSQSTGPAAAMPPAQSSVPASRETQRSAASDPSGRTRSLPAESGATVESSRAGAEREAPSGQAPSSEGPARAAVPDGQGDVRAQSGSPAAIPVGQPAGSGSRETQRGPAPEPSGRTRSLPAESVATVESSRSVAQRVAPSLEEPARTAIPDGRQGDMRAQSGSPAAIPVGQSAGSGSRETQRGPAPESSGSARSIPAESAAPVEKRDGRSQRTEASTRQGSDPRAVLRAEAAQATVVDPNAMSGRASDVPSSGGPDAVQAVASGQMPHQGGTQATDAPAQSPRLTPGEPPSPQDVVGQVVRGARFLLGNGVSEVRVRLEPPELGTVRIRLVSGGSGLSGEISVSNREVRGVVESNLHALRSALSEHGLNPGQLTVSVREDQGGGLPQHRGDYRSQGETPEQRRDPGRDGNLDWDPREEQRRSRRSQNLVDYLA